jgi:hypothetical protein
MKTPLYFFYPMEREEICYGIIMVADEQVVRGKGANIKIKRKVEKAVFLKSDTEWKGFKIVEIIDFIVVGHRNTPN